MTLVAILPARGGSVRVPKKNIKPFFGKPIMTYPIAAARETGLFDMIVISTDDDEIADVAIRCGAQVYRRDRDVGARGTQDVAREVLMDMSDDVRAACVLYPTAALICAADIHRCIPMIIAPGKEREVLLRLLAGEDLGTFFVPRQRAYHGRKVCLAHLPKPAGDLILDAGAMVAMEKGGKSLLPIVIREVRGTFGVGAAVRCLAEDGHTIGVGLSNYKSGEIERIKGHRSEEIETLIGYKHSDEVIHRNNFVLAGEHLASETE